MPILLSIDTAGETASVILGNEQGVVASETNANQKTHASFLQPALQHLLSQASVSFADVDAIAVVNGPGSYTGLRVGLASAKAIAFATRRPLILLNTLTVMASAAIETYNDANLLYCPLIDARRNEVFTAAYDFEMNPLLPPQPLILEASSFRFLLEKQKIVFFGSGHNKCGKIISHENTIFADVSYTSHHIHHLSYRTYQAGHFSDMAYSEPFYTKEFFSTG